MIIINTKTGANLKVNYYPEKVLAYLLERTIKNKGKTFITSYKEIGEFFQRSESWAYRSTKPLIELELVEWNHNGDGLSTTARAFEHYTTKEY